VELNKFLAFQALAKPKNLSETWTVQIESGLFQVWQGF